MIEKLCHQKNRKAEVLAMTENIMVFDLRRSHYRIDSGDGALPGPGGSGGRGESVAKPARRLRQSGRYPLPAQRAQNGRGRGAAPRAG